MSAAHFRVLDHAAHAWFLLNPARTAFWT